MSFFIGEVLFFNLNIDEKEILTPEQVSEVERYRESTKNCHWILNSNNSGFIWDGIIPFSEYSPCFYQFTDFLVETIRVRLRGRITVEDENGDNIERLTSHTRPTEWYPYTSAESPIVGIMKDYTFPIVSRSGRFGNLDEPDTSVTLNGDFLRTITGGDRIYARYPSLFSHINVDTNTDHDNMPEFEPASPIIYQGDRC